MPSHTASRARRFDQVAAPHLDAAYNLARWLTGNHHDAEDVVQEACLRAFRFLDGFHGGNPRAWLLAIVRNTCMSWLGRNRSPIGFATIDEEEEAEPQHQNGCDTPESLLLRALDAQRVNQLVADLPLELREVLILREMEELSYREIAAVIGVPLGTVMSRLSRARLQLRRSWDRDMAKEAMHGL